MALALSGGLDSVVLLDLLKPLGAKLGFQFSAIHVNHQLSSRAGEWAEFCAGLCMDYEIPLQIVAVNVAEAVGESLEAAARAARYAALLACKADFIVLAHHLDDQVETLLLQLLRGCGVAGASAMAEHSGRLLRPLLQVSRSTLEEHARRRGLSWVDDESNADTRFDRNFLRHRLLPVVAERFPGYRETLGRASRNFSESACLQDELAAHDAVAAIRDGRLLVAALGRLSFARAKNLLRYYLKQHAILAPSAARIEDTLHQLLKAGADAGIRVAFGRVELRRFLGQVWVIPLRAPPPLSMCHAWQGEGAIELPELGGILKFWAVRGQGVSLAHLQQELPTIRVRQGGERLQPDCRRPRRSLKHLFQEAGLPPWERSRMPLLYSGETLVAATGVGVDCAYQAKPDEPGIMLEWGR